MNGICVGVKIKNTFQMDKSSMSSTGGTEVYLEHNYK